MQRAAFRCPARGPIFPGSDSEHPLECVTKRRFGVVTDRLGNLTEFQAAATQQLTRFEHPPIGQILHRRLSYQLTETVSKGGPRQADGVREFSHAPMPVDFLMHQMQRCACVRIGQGPEPSRFGIQFGRYECPDHLNEEYFGKAIYNDFGPRSRLARFIRQRLESRIQP